MSRPRDNQKQRLYNAEDKFCYQTPRLETVKEMQAYVDKLTGSAWWKRRWPHVHHIEVKDGRGRRRANGSSSGRYIKMPKWCRHEMIVLHEISHVVAPRREASHGPGFVRIYAELIGHKLGADMRRAFLASCKANRVKYRRG